MSDFGADTSDFHSDFASDFRTEWSDYASDFHDFPGDFGGEPRTAKRPPEAPENAPPEQWTATGKPQWSENGGKLAEPRASGKPRSRGQRHAARP